MSYNPYLYVNFNIDKLLAVTIRYCEKYSIFVFIYWIFYHTSYYFDKSLLILYGKNIDTRTYYYYVI